MTRFIKWAAIVSGTVIGGTVLFRAVQSGRQRMKHALGHAERVAEHTRAALQQTETALHEAREAI